MKYRIVFSGLMAFVLSFLMSGWVTWVNLGLSPDFPGQWLAAFRLAWPAAALIAFLLGPTIQGLSAAITKRL
ncbi:DUF2798 domain-containing protein [Roseibium sp.]|uniref:DUF2798 domain-containing protein n=1 Tax=Roseibium sp. TaxID=1936156 RepID=UPI003A983178